MRYDSIVSDDAEKLDEVWAGLKNWLQYFVPGPDKAMFGSAKEMQRYIAYWVTEFMRLAARYQDDEGNPITRKTLQQLPLPVMRLYLLRVMGLPAAEAEAILAGFNKHPLTAKSNFNLKRPLNLARLSKQQDKTGQANTVDSYFKKHGVNPDAMSTWSDAEKFVNQLIAMAATRKMEIDNLGDTPTSGTGTDREPGRAKATSGKEPGKGGDYVSTLLDRMEALRRALEQLKAL